MTALLDVNVLIALLDSDHRFHAPARSWLAAHRTERWATCPITENGAVRILSQPGYERPVTARQASELLARMGDGPEHDFWPCDVSIADLSLFVLSATSGARQLTDVYLLGLAVAKRGRFVTLDRHIPLAAVHGATADHLVVL